MADRELGLLLVLYAALGAAFVFWFLMPPQRRSPHGPVPAWQWALAGVLWPVVLVVVSWMAINVARRNLRAGKVG